MDCRARGDFSNVKRWQPYIRQNYGVWGIRGPQPGMHIKLSGQRLKGWLGPRDSRVAMAAESGGIISYAIAVQTSMPGYGVVSWVTQLVVDEFHRQRNVAKKLLFTIWQFSDISPGGW